ncbi:hypothetical protein [Peptostreptococcus sp. D1]|uniref:hypothetical protein n=1 Tax=Peptostreptococcus sp. D1 TaxID=72304 RepID=UPI0008E47746|nr:hypothetical protein [Peptostreptococcus sp. D1]SFE87523.1 hypothetical protein SAMN02910278_01930 [Peptostreptococcus sp. D1]
MHDIKIWDRVERLKGLDSSVWLNAYPQASTKTLVLVDDTSVYFLEDIKEQGFSGESDIEIVNAFLKKKDDESKANEKQEKSLEELISEKATEIATKIVDKAKVENALGVAELSLKIDEVDVKGSTAVAEISEILATLTS